MIQLLRVDHRLLHGKIFEATKSNWDRVGNVRFAGTYKPDGEAFSKSFAKGRAELIASEWLSLIHS